DACTYSADQSRQTESRRRRQEPSGGAQANKGNGPVAGSEPAVFLRPQSHRRGRAGAIAQPVVESGACWRTSPGRNGRTIKNPKGSSFRVKAGTLGVMPEKRITLLASQGLLTSE